MGGVGALKRVIMGELWLGHEYVCVCVCVCVCEEERERERAACLLKTEFV